MKFGRKKAILKPPVTNDFKVKAILNNKLKVLISPTKNEINILKSFLKLGSKYTLGVWSGPRTLGFRVFFLLPSVGKIQDGFEGMDPGVVDWKDGVLVVVSSIK